MAKFTDRHGREWMVDVTVGTVMRLRQDLDLDIVDLLGGKTTIWDLLADPVTLVRIIYVTCRDQLEPAKVSVEEFAGGLAGPSLRAAAEAFKDSYANFIDDPEKAALFRDAMNKAQAAISAVTTKAARKMKEISVEALAESLMSRSTGLPGSCELIPSPTPTVNS